MKAVAPIALGVAIGIAYTLSPVSVLSALAIVAVIHFAARGIDGDERRWLLTMLGVAAAARAIAILALFLSADHATVAFRTVFGDEEYFLQRSLWLRNFAAGITIHPADFVYAFDDGRRTSYTYFLALVQLLAGPSPYGLHLTSVAFFMAASAVLYRLARRSFGPTPALLGLGILLFLPSLFAWSISVLKEPIYVLTLVLGLAAAVAGVRADAWPRRTAALLLVLVSAVAAQSLRDGGFLMAAFGGGVGLAAGVAATRPRLAIAAATAMLLAIAVALSIGRVQDRVVFSVRHAASVHWDNVNTAGYAYPILEPAFYENRLAVDRLTLSQGARYIAGAFVKFVLVPEPWNTQSRAALAYVPEQVVWYLLVLLLPAGLVAAFQRDPLLAALLAAYTVSAASIVALNSGNVGTLVRHRGLALPFLIWLSALGACEVMRLMRQRGQEVHADHR